MAGRGVDILLGGNPEGPGQDRPGRRRPSIPRATRGRRGTRSCSLGTRTSAASKATRCASSAVCMCSAPSATRAGASTTSCEGRSGRQGDPGESRFYLSLGDELMRLFATGAMQWVMNKALPEDQPIDSRMVSRCHRASPGHGRGPQRGDSQGRPQVRRGDERAAQGHLPAVASRSSTARAFATRASSRSTPPCSTSSRRTVPPTSPRTGTSRAS